MCRWNGVAERPTRVCQSEAAGAPAYLIEAPEYFSRPSIYGYGDDHERFAFFSRAALALLQALDWQPDIIHANDWPCGFAAIELRARRRYDAFLPAARERFSQFTTSLTRVPLIPVTFGGWVSAIRLTATISCSKALLQL